MKKRSTSDALTIIHRRYYQGNAKRRAGLDRARQELNLAVQLYALRSNAGLTQQKLAKLVGTTPSVISRMESADYAGHSLTMIQRVASALDQGVEIRFVKKRLSVPRNEKEKQRLRAGKAVTSSHLHSR